MLVGNRSLMQYLRGRLGTGKLAPKLVQLAEGDIDDFRDTCPLFGSSKTWTSLTPFVPVRNPKTRHNGEPKIDPDNGFQIGSPEHDLLRLLREPGNAMGEGGWIDPKTSIASIEQVDKLDLSSGRIFRWLQFTTRRDGNSKILSDNDPNEKGHRASGSFGCGLRLTFSDYVSGPIAVGYGAHFGLGLFKPADKENID